VVSTPLKNISQIGSSSQPLGKIKKIPNHQPDIDIYIYTPFSRYLKIVAKDLLPSSNQSWLSGKIIQLNGEFSARHGKFLAKGSTKLPFRSHEYI
jgi:hypothetical protein